MRTKAFEDMIVAATAHYPSNPIIGVGEIVGIRTIEKKKPRKKKQMPAMLEQMLNLEEKNILRLASSKYNCKTILY